jgi:hypothetical protein
MEQLEQLEPVEHAAAAQAVRAVPVMHVAPAFAGEREHDAAVSCWCGPWLENVDANHGQVWVHRRLTAAPAAERATQGAQRALRVYEVFRDGSRKS